MNTDHLVGWLPIRLYWQGVQAMVDWCFMDERRFAEPFFEQTIGACLRNPFEVIFRHQTPIELLGELYHERPGIAPSGFIFHMSRCGSTLLAQSFASLPQAVVLSEPGPVEHVLRANRRNPAVSDEQRVEWLRWMIGALGQPRAGGERHLFVKFDSWHTLDLPLIARAFPNVPWIFVYRNPVEVMVSHQRQPGAQMVPGMILPMLEVLGPEAMQEPLAGYCARVLHHICAAALRYRTLGAARLINYAQLPDAIAAEIAPFFGVGLDAEARAAVQRVAAVHAKQPKQPFVVDTDDKRNAANPELRAFAAQWVDPLYRQLEALRLARPEFSLAS